MKRRERDRATRGAKDYRLLWAGLLLLVALIFACVGFSCGHIRRGLKNAADAEMAETTGENAAMLRLTLESRFALLDNVAEKIAEDPQNAREMLTNLGKYANGYGFKRLGYMNSTGRTVTSDGETGDFFYRAYFRMGMDGQYCITGEINDRLGNGEAVHIMSAPVHNPKTGKVIGVVFADYTPEMFHQMMDVETFGGEGHGYIVESSGEIVVASSSARLTGTGNLLDGVADFSETGRQDAEALRQVLAGEQPGEGRVLGAGKLRFCCRKIENGRQDDTWYLVMVMDAGALYGRMYGVFSSICSLLSVTVLMCAVFIFAILTAYRRYNEGLRQAAYTDALTGGSNFSGFLMKVNNAEGGYMVSCDLNDYRMIASMFGAQKGDELLRGVYECIKSGLTEGEPVARVDADHFAFHLVERQRSAVLERLRQIERRIRRLSDKMGVIHLVPRFGIYAMRPEEDARRSCELANLALGAARSSADNTVAFYQDLDQNAFFENMQLEDRFDEAIGEQKLVQAFGHEAQTLAAFDEVNERLRDCSLKATFFSSLTNPCTRFVNSLVYAAVGFAGALAAVNGRLTIGGLSSFLSYANQYTKPFNEISGVVTELQNALACAGRVFELIDEPAQTPDPADAEQIDRPDGAVSIDHVYFSYAPDRKLIEDFTLHVQPGQRVAIVGPTGCGKTTIINLLMRFYDVDSGEIHVDGHETRRLTRRSLRENIAMVMQDTWLSAGTIRENIAMGKPDATDEEIIAAAKASHAHSFIKRLPDGYNTVISESGGQLSQGQKQLLCIARVML